MQERPGIRRSVLIMLAVYAAWGALYLLTAWIGALRGPALDVALSLDRDIPYIPAFQWVYALCYIVPFGLFAIDRSPRFLDRAYLVFIAANAVAFVIFAALPVLGPARDAVEAHPADHNLFLSLVYAVDSRYNAFPSLHVTNPWLIALLSRERHGAASRTLLFFALAVLITAATLFVRQHYLLDGVAGIALAFAAATAAARLHPWHNAPAA